MLASGLRVNGQPLKVTAPDASTVVRDAARHRSVPASRFSTTCTCSRSTSSRRAGSSGTFAQALGVGHAAGRARQHRAVHAAQLRARTAAGVRSQPALLEEGRGRHPAAVLSIRSSSRSCPIRTRSWCGCSPGQIDMLQQQIRPKTSPRCGRSIDQGTLQVIELGVGVDPDLFFFNLRLAVLGEGSAPRLDHAQGVPQGDLARGRSRGLRQHRVPRRRRADLGTDHARQQGVVLAQRARATATRSSAPRRSSAGSA